MRQIYREAFFKDADLSYSNLEDANLGLVEFTNADLRYVNFKKVDVAGARLDGANREGVKSLTAKMLIEAWSIHNIRNCPVMVL